MPEVIEAGVVVNGPFPHLDFELNPEFLNFTERKYDRPCPPDRTGTFCESEVHNYSVHAQLTRRRPFYRFLKVPEWQASESGLVLTIEGGESPKLGLFQLAIDIGQVAKFGGIPLFFANISQANYEIGIRFADHPEIEPESMLYFTLYEAVEERRGITISARLVRVMPSDGVTRTNADALITRKRWWEIGLVVALGTLMYSVCWVLACRIRARRGRHSALSDDSSTMRLIERWEDRAM